MKKIGVIIGGAGGYMGMKGVAALPSLEDELNKIGASIEFVDLVEPMPQKFDTIRKCSSQLKLSKEIRCYDFTLEEVIDLIDNRRLGIKYPVLVYDATPTTFHFAHLKYITQKQDSSILYLGEKPIFTDLSELKNFQQEISTGQDFFCELIETVNPVFTNIRDYLRSNDLTSSIKSIELWRAGCSGLKKALEVSRDGVEGGALEDKSLHDLSISVGLFGVANIQGFDIEKAEIHSLIPHSNYFRSDIKSFLDIGNKEAKEVKSDLKRELECPADGLFSLDVLWKSDNKKVLGRYLFSWLGVSESDIENSFKAKLSNLGFPVTIDETIGNLQQYPRCWLDIAEILEKEVGSKVFQLAMKEARIGIIEILTSTNRQYIVCNFLAKYNIRRFAYLLKEISGKVEFAECLYIDPPESGDYGAKKSNDLSTIFFKVIKQAFGIEDADLINARASTLIHDILIRARKKAHKDLDTNMEYWYQIIETLCNQHIHRIN